MNAQTESLPQPMIDVTGYLSPEAGNNQVTREDFIRLAINAGITPDDLTPKKPKIVNDCAGFRLLRRYGDKDDCMIYKTVDAKYGFVIGSADPHRAPLANLVNLDTGIAIPHFEPVFILRGQDKYASQVIGEYCRLVTNAGTTVNPMTEGTASAAHDRFVQFRNEYPRLMKHPD